MTNAEARFNKSLRPRKPEGSLGRTAQDGHLDSHTAPELWVLCASGLPLLWCFTSTETIRLMGVGVGGIKENMELLALQSCQFGQC